MVLHKNLEQALDAGSSRQAIEQLIEEKNINFDAHLPEFWRAAVLRRRIDLLDFGIEFWKQGGRGGQFHSALDINGKKQNIAHLAVVRDDEELLSWVVDQELTACLEAADNQGQTPLEVAVKGKRHNLAWLLTSEARIVPWTHFKYTKPGSWEKMLQGCDADMVHILHLALRERQVQDLFFVTEPLSMEELEAVLSQDTHRWWPISPHDEPWSDTEIRWIVMGIREAASKGDLRMVEWFLDWWNIDGLQALTSRLDDQLSVVDYIGVGELARSTSNVAHMMVSGYVDVEQQEQEPYRVSYRDAREKLNEVARFQWDGKAPLSSVLKRWVLQMNERSSFRMFEKRDFEAWLLFFEDETWEKRCQTLQMLIRRFGRQVMPRVDLLARTGQHQVLKWLSDQGFLPLDSLIALSYEEEVDTAEAEASSAVDTPQDLDEQEEDLCAICMEPMRSSVTLPCNHRFCRSCMHTLWQRAGASQQQSTSCPLCRARVAVLPLELEDLIIRRLEQTYPSIYPLLSPGMRIAHVLLLIAVHTGTISVVQWLLTSGKIDHLTRFGAGRTIMHLACSRNDHITVRWLMSNSPFRDLAWEFSDEGLLPLHEALLNGRGADVFRSEFQDLVTEDQPADRAGKLWTLYAKESGNKSLADLAEKFISNINLQNLLPQLVLDGASSAEIIAAIEENNFALTKHPSDGIEFLGRVHRFLSLLVTEARIEVLQWLYAQREHQTFWMSVTVEGFDLWVSPDEHEQRKKLLFTPDVAQALAERQCRNRDAVLAFYSELNEVEKLKNRIYPRLCELGKLFQMGNVEKLQLLLEEQRQDLANVGKSWRQLFEGCDFAMKLSQQLRLGQVSVCNLPVFQWLLKEFSGSFGSLQIIRVLHRSLNCYHEECVHLFFDEAARRHVDLNRTIESEDYRLSMREDPIISVAVQACFQHSVEYREAMMLEESTQEGGSKFTYDAKQLALDRVAALKQLKWVISRPEVKLSPPDSEPLLNVLVRALKWNYIEGLGGGLPRDDDPDAKSQYILDVVRTLTDAGMDCHQPNIEVDELVGTGCLGLIRLIALEQDVNIQDVDLESPLSRFCMTMRLSKTKPELIKKKKKKIKKAAGRTKAEV